MKIIDINDKEREVVSIAKDEVDSVFYVKVCIIGKSGREWVEWYSLHEFRKKNPDIKLKEI